MTLSRNPGGSSTSAPGGGGQTVYVFDGALHGAGAPRQPLHPDTPFSARLRVATCTVALQDIAMTQGPTNYLPRTHIEPLATDDAHDLLRLEELLQAVEDARRREDVRHLVAHPKGGRDAADELNIGSAGAQRAQQRGRTTRDLRRGIGASGTRIGAEDARGVGPLWAAGLATR